jgi:hypothetical protein
MDFRMALRHWLHPFFDVAAIDRGDQVGFHAYHFADDMAALFGGVRRRRIPLPYPLCTTLMLIGTRR